MFRQILCTSKLVIQAAIPCNLSPKYVNPSNLFAYSSVVNGSDRKFGASFTNNYYVQHNHSPGEQPSFPYLPFTKLCEQKRFPLPVKTSSFGKKFDKESFLKSFYKGAESCWNNPTSLVSPVVQVFAIHIHTDFEEQQVEIYGSIWGVEKHGYTFSLYDRDPADPEIIVNQGHHLSLSDSSEYSFITCSVGDDTKLDLQLKDKIRGIDIINGEYVLFSRTSELDESCDRLRKAIIQGQHGFATVYYTIFKHSVVGAVTLNFPKDSCPKYDIYGTIVAMYTDSRLNCFNEDDMKHMRTTLFSKEFDKSVRTRIADPVKLPRYVIAVPAYSKLKIELDLWDSQGPFARGSADFIARGVGAVHEDIQGKCGLISVTVDWKDTFSSRNYMKERGITICEEWNAEKTELISCNEQVTPAFNPFRSIRSSLGMSPAPGKAMLELFSVYVSGGTHKISTLCGKIVFDNGFRLTMYERDLSSPRFESEDKSIIPLEIHSALRDGYISIGCFLMDPISNLEVCHGYMGWGESNIEDRCLYNRRLCSVVCGPQGYAAVHYMVLKEGCSANVEIYVSFDNTEDADVFGCVFARYGNHDYSTAYEKRYYQSRLFDNPRDGEGLTHLQTGSKLPLLKSVVAVSMDDTLIIEAVLRATSDADPDPVDEALCGIIAFGVDLSATTSRKIIRGTRFCIDVAVKFDISRF